MANANPITEAACNAITALLVAFPTIPIESVHDALDIIRGTKRAVALDNAATTSSKPYTVEEAVRLTGLSPQGLNYHARRGRIHRAYIPGSSRAIGYVRADIDAIVEGRAK